VKVLSYNKREATFILSIATDQLSERIIIYRPDHALSFQTAIEHVGTARKTPLSGATGAANDPWLHKKDVIKIPYLKIDATTDLSGLLKGKLYFSGEKVPWTINTARQITRFDLFEKGAKIQVVNEAETQPFGPAPRRGQTIYVPRNFVCDGPFFVAAWLDDAPMPYFAAWIGDPDAMIPFGGAK
jgi:hypothetical protein